MSEGETGEEGIESKTRSGHMQKQTFKVKQGASETDKPRNKRKENKKKSKTSSTSVPLCFIFKTSIVCVCAFSFLFVFLPLRLKKINFCSVILYFHFYFFLHCILLNFCSWELLMMKATKIRNKGLQILCRSGNPLFVQ